MKKMNIKKINIDIVMCTLLSLYFSFVCSWDYTETLRGSKFLLKLFLIFILTEIIFLYIFNKLKKIRIDRKAECFRKRELFMYFLIIIIPLVFAMLSFYPTLGCQDTYFMWNDVGNRIVSNWQPVAYQILFVWVPSLISNNIYSVVIFQVIFEAIILLYLCVWLRKINLSFKQTILILLVIVLNPIFLKFSVYAGKDVPYSYCILLLTLYLINIVRSDGKWLEPPINKMFLILSSIGVLVLRHNGIVPFVSSFILLILVYPKLRKFFLIVTIVIISSFYVITNPVFRYFGIGGTGGKIEMIGVALNSLAYYYNNSAVYISEEERNVLHKIHPKSVWTIYRTRNFNDLKNYEFKVEECTLYEKYCNTYFGDRLMENFDDVLRVYFDISVSHPYYFIKSYLHTTSPIWEITPYVSGKNAYWHNVSFPAFQFQKINTLYNNYYDFVSLSPVRVLALGFGESLFVVVASFMLIICKKKFEIKKIIPFVPTLFNTILIMLLITGEEYRFVYSNILCSLPILVYSLSECLNFNNTSKVRK